MEARLRGFFSPELSGDDLSVHAPAYRAAVQQLTEHVPLLMGSARRPEQTSSTNRASKSHTIRYVCAEA
ncbi:uncharacterized [Tachysurus ichikawai]